MSDEQRGSASVLRGLRRITTTGAYDPAIDGLRFVAISLVVMLHVNTFVSANLPPAEQLLAARSVVGKVAALGGIGVPLFFVLSGFVLGTPFARAAIAGGPPVQLRRYYLRRLTRLELPYLLNLLLLFTALVVVRGRSADTLLPHLEASALYVHNLVYGRMSDVNGVAWSLEIEAQFYCLAPLLALVFKIRRAAARRAVLLVAMLAGGLSLAVDDPSPRLAMSLFWFVQYFAAGFLLADLRSQSEPLARVPDAVRMVCGAAFLAGVIALAGNPAGALVEPLLIFGAFLCVLAPGKLRRFFSLAPLATIGGMCYTIYLYHYTVISAVGPGLSRVGRVAALGYAPYYGIQLGLIGAAILIVATGLYVGVERPCMDPRWPLRLREIIPSRLTRAAGP